MLQKSNLSSCWLVASLHKDGNPIQVKENGHQIFMLGDDVVTIFIICKIGMVDALARCAIQEPDVGFAL